jgi:hypothetical protein
MKEATIIYLRQSDSKKLNKAVCIRIRSKIDQIISMSEYNLFFLVNRRNSIIVREIIMIGTAYGLIALNMIRIAHSILKHSLSDFAYTFVFYSEMKQQVIDSKN